MQTTREMQSGCPNQVKGPFTVASSKAVPLSIYPEIHESMRQIWEDTLVFVLSWSSIREQYHLCERDPLGHEVLHSQCVKCMYCIIAVFFVITDKDECMLGGDCAVFFMALVWHNTGLEGDLLIGQMGSLRFILEPAGIILGDVLADYHPSTIHSAGHTIMKSLRVWS